MRSMQCHVEFGYQLSIRSGTTENLNRVGEKENLIRTVHHSCWSGPHRRHHTEKQERRAVRATLWRVTPGHHARQPERSASPL
jgi:hypothetical protein